MHKKHGGSSETRSWLAYAYAEYATLRLSSLNTTSNHSVPRWCLTAEAAARAAPTNTPRRADSSVAFILLPEMLFKALYEHLRSLITPLVSVHPCDGSADLFLALEQQPYFWRQSPGIGQDHFNFITD